MLRVLLTFIGLCIALSPRSSFFAQSNCGFDQRFHERLDQDPAFERTLQTRENAIATRLKQRRVDRGVTTIPVVVHVLHKGERIGTGTNISNAQIHSAISQLNKAFNGEGHYTGPTSDIRFALAARTNDCAPSSGIVRVNANGLCEAGDCYGTVGITSKNESAVKALSYWPSESYLNIWVVSEIDGNNALNGIQGFAQFPGDAPATDGVVILHNAMGYDLAQTKGYNLKQTTRLSAILVHEIGHSLGLYHSFEGDDYNRDGYGDRCPSASGCGAYNGDCVADTPPHRRSAGNCEPNQTNVCDGGHSNIRFIHNFMDYSSEACQTEFTAGQIARMRAVLATERASLALSNGNLPVVTGGPVSATCSPQTKNLATDLKYGIIEFRLGTMAKSSGTAVEDGGYLDNWCASFNVRSGTSYNISLHLKNKQNVAVFCDYNGDGDFDDVGEKVLSSDNAVLHAGVMTIPGHSRKAVPIRLRAISGYPGLPIPNACYAPYYGQVEDYSLIVDGLEPPSKIIEFDGDQSGGVNNLFWKIGDEINDRTSYVLERSEDGLTFGRIAAFSAGNSHDIKHTGYKDIPDDLQRTAYYRLLVIGSNGDHTYSEVIELGSSAVVKSDIGIFPNPIVDRHLFLRSRLSSLHLQRIELLDAAGRMLQTMPLDQTSDRTMQLKLPDMVPGIYYLRIVEDHQSTVLKLTKL